MKRALKATNGVLMVLFIAAAAMSFGQENSDSAALFGSVLWFLVAYLTFRAADAPNGALYGWARGLNIFGLACLALVVIVAGTSALDSEKPFFGVLVLFLILAAPPAWNLYALAKVKRVAEDEIELLPAESEVMAPSASEPTASGNYFMRHWRGELSLPVSYWINGSFVGIAFLMLALLLGDMAKQWELRPMAYTMLGVFVVSILVTIWSVVGIMRSAGEHANRGGSAGWARAAQILTVLSVVSFAGRLGTETGPQMVEYASIAFDSDAIKRVNATVATNGQSLALRGTMGTGSYDHVKQVLGAAPAVRTVVLDSTGGRLREAELIAELVRERGLNTYVENQCLSACTYVFLAGADRAATPNARIGFHRPSFAGTSEFEAGVAAMLAYYRSAGIAESFLARIRETPSNDMWYPTRDELIDNGVLNRVSLGGETSSAYTQIRSRSELALSYRSLPFMRALDERFPGTIDRALDAAWAQVEAGATDADISAASRGVISDVYPMLLRTADDAGLQGFLELMIKQLSAARELGPKACALYLEAKLDATKVFPRALIQEEMSWGLRVLEGQPVARPALARGEFEAAVQPLLAQLPQSYLSVVSAPEQFVDQPKLRCDAMLAFYEGVAEMPGKARATVLRGLFQSEE